MAHTNEWVVARIDREVSCFQEMRREMRGGRGGLQGGWTLRERFSITAVDDAKPMLRAVSRKTQ